jgi:predicted transcriptional regulator
VTPIEVFQSVGPQLQALFNSNLVPQALLALKEHPHTIAGLRDRIPGTSGSFYSVMQKMGKEGLIERENKEYALSNSGLFLSSKLEKLLNTINSTCQGRPAEIHPENEAHQDRLALYHHHKKFFRWIFNSSLVLLILLSLHERAKTRRELRDDTGSLSQNIRTRLRQMEQWRLVSEEGYACALTTEGFRIVSAIEELLHTYRVTVTYSEFWNRYSLNWVPPEFFDKIHEMHQVTINYDGSGYTNYVNYQTYLNILSTGEHVHGISPWITPEMADGVAKQAYKGTPVSMVFSPELALQIFREYFSSNMNYLKAYPHVDFSVYPGPITFGLTVTDACLILKLPLKDDRSFDSARIMGCGSPDACRWSERIFNYYRRRSMPFMDFIAKESHGPTEDAGRTAHHSGTVPES